MGMGEEMMEEMMLYEYLEEDKYKHRTTWETRDGRTLKIVEMETDHIINTINYLRNVGRTPPALMLKVLKIRDIVKGEING